MSMTSGSSETPNRVRLVMFRDLNHQVVPKETRAAGTQKRGTFLLRRTTREIKALTRACSFLADSGPSYFYAIPRNIAGALASHRVTVSAPGPRLTIRILSEPDTRIERPHFLASEILLKYWAHVRCGSK